MKLSLYTFVKNGLHFDYHIVDMLKHHVDLADEIIVNEGYSTDGTFEAIRDLDPKIKVYQFDWTQGEPKDQYVLVKSHAREQCTGDWCVLIDADEFIPEWEFERLREFCETTDKDLARFRFMHFYGNYKVYCPTEKRANLPSTHIRIHRNLPEIELYGDGATLRLKSGQLGDRVAADEFACHHFSTVRHPARLRQKWKKQQREDNENRRSRVPSFLFDVFPHDWMDQDFLEYLEVYEGPYIRAIRENPNEFIRDEMKLYEYLAAKT